MSMKSLLSAVLAMLVILNCVVVAHAEDNSGIDGVQKSATVTVTSLDELQTAISAAIDGDTITIGKTIVIENDCLIGTASKRITLICAYGLQGNMIKISGGNISFENLRKL